MKKHNLFLLLLILIVLNTADLHAAARPLNIYANLCQSEGDCKGLCTDLGIELPLSDNFYIQAGADYYSDMLDDAYQADLTAFGLNLHALFKFRFIPRIRLFLKAGLHYSGIRLTTDIQESKYIEFRDYAPGLSAGTGLEFRLNRRIRPVAGLTIKSAHRTFTVAGAKFSAQTWWVKLYFGLNFTL